MCSCQLRLVQMSGDKSLANFTHLLIFKDNPFVFLFCRYHAHDSCLSVLLQPVVLLITSAKVKVYKSTIQIGKRWEKCSRSEPVLLNDYGAPELFPRNEFRQPM